jgi:hypothetical protein
MSAPPTEEFQVADNEQDKARKADLNEKLKAWEDFYNFHRPHFSHQGKTPYEMMRLLLRKDEETSGRV